MHHKDRVTGQQRQEACQANTNHSRTISLGSIAKTQNNGPTRRHHKTGQKSTMHKQYIHHKNGPCINNSTHQDKTANNGEDITQINREMNNEQVIGDNRVPLNRDAEDKSKDSDGCIRTRYSRMIRKPDRLAY